MAEENQKPAIQSGVEEKEKPELTDEDIKIKKKKRISKMIVGFCFFVVITVGLSLICFCRQIFGDEVGDTILGPGVNDGFAAIGDFFKTKKDAIIASLILIFVLFVLYYVIALLFRIFTGKSARSKTVSSIIVSFLKYILVIIGVLSILGIWGVNTAGIIASLGIVGIIIGTGCKTIINDMIAGFFIVVDNYYQVGDRIEVDGFVGDVISIGLRTTKIKLGARTKSICNSRIDTVINVSRSSNPVIVKVDVSFNEDLRHVEAVLAKELPKIKDRIPMLTDDVVYRGVTALDECGVELEFFTKTDLANEKQASKLLLRELYLIFIDNNFCIPFKQVVVNGPDSLDTVKASSEDIKVSRKEIEKLFPKNENTTQSFSFIKPKTKKK